MIRCNALMEKVNKKKCSRSYRVNDMILFYQQQYSLTDWAETRSIIVDSLNNMETSAGWKKIKINFFGHIKSRSCSSYVWPTTSILLLLHSWSITSSRITTEAYTLLYSNRCNNINNGKIYLRPLYTHIRNDWEWLAFVRRFFLG